MISAYGKFTEYDISSVKSEDTFDYYVNNNIK